MPRSPTRKSCSPAAPAPDPEDLSPPDPSEAGPAARDGREANGRFAKGNLGGPGNPFARQTAALRKQLLEAVTKEDMDAICTMLILRARGGSIPHLKLLFSYVIGKPTDAVNPDTLDRQEMEQYRQELGMEDLVLAVGRALTPAFACIVVRAIRPVIMERIGTALADQLLQGVPPEFLPTDPDAETDREDETIAPSPNGEIGAEEEPGEPLAEAEAREEGPSTNGEIGPEAQAAAAAPGRASNGTPRPARTQTDRPAPPWPDGRRPAPPPRARGPAARDAGGGRTPGGPGGPRSPI
jgi:hypothetical protein